MNKLLGQTLEELKVELISKISRIPEGATASIRELIKTYDDEKFPFAKDIEDYNAALESERIEDLVAEQKEWDDARYYLTKSEDSFYSQTIREAESLFAMKEQCNKLIRERTEELKNLVGVK